MLGMRAKFESIEETGIGEGALWRVGRKAAIYTGRERMEAHIFIRQRAGRGRLRARRLGALARWGGASSILLDRAQGQTGQ